MCSGRPDGCRRACGCPIRASRPIAGAAERAARRAGRAFRRPGSSARMMPPMTAIPAAPAFMISDKLLAPIPPTAITGTGECLAMAETPQHSAPDHSPACSRFRKPDRRRCSPRLMPMRLAPVCGPTIRSALQVRAARAPLLYRLPRRDALHRRPRLAPGCVTVQREPRAELTSDRQQTLCQRDLIGDGQILFTDARPSASGREGRAENIRERLSRLLAVGDQQSGGSGSLTFQNLTCQPGRTAGSTASA